MNINKNTYVYAGIGLFFLLVYLNSSKNVQLVEVSTEAKNTASFTSDMIPFALRPPTRLSENEPIPVSKYLRKTSLNGVNFMPRFEF